MIKSTMFSFFTSNNKTALFVFSGVLLSTGAVVGRCSTPSKTITTVKTEYVDRVKVEYIERKSTSASNSSQHASSSNEVKNNIKTTTKITKPDGTIIESTTVDTSSVLGSSATSLVNSFTNTSQETSQTNTIESIKTVESTKVVDSGKTAGFSIFDFAVGASYKGIKIGDTLNGFDYKQGGLSGEVRAWNVGVQAQVFGDRTVIGTVKMWF
jgi:hypothetical protein